MPLSRIIKKASNFILRSQYETSTTPTYTDGEIVFCKNNVCVHPPTMVRQETDIVHHPGYLTVTSQTVGNKCTLFLSWIPNTTLRKHPGTVEQRSSSVTRTGTDSDEKVGTRRRSTSACRTSSGVHIGRRYSSGSYESECVGCFPDNKLSTELKDIYISKGSISSCSDNNSLTPSEDLKFDAVKNKQLESSLNNEEQTSEGRLNKHDSNHNDSNEAYQKLLECRLDPSRSNVIIEEPLVQNENNSTVPKINPSSSNTSSLVSDSSSSCQLKVEENNAKDLPNSENTDCDESDRVSSFNGVNTNSSKANPPAVYAFQRPEGILYVDSLVLQENPHILNIKSSCGGPNRRLEESRVRETERRMSVQSNEDGPSPLWMSSPELLALKHNLSFPDSLTASPVVRRAQKCCRKFCVDLSEMRSLRLFFCDAESTKGQLVVASRECQYKILHFHHGGLERLATVLQQWNLLSPTTPSDNLPYRHFMVCRPAMDDSELHPEEGKVGMVNEAEWKEMLNPLGQVEDDLVLRKGIFLGGLEPCLRKIVWPFLLYCYSYQSTAAEREHITAIRRKEYQLITKKRLSLEGAAKERFFRNIQCVVEKDVIRTDRGNPYYAGDSNPHVETMKNILLNYAIYDSGSGYMQGMSDLLAPVLAEIGHEADAFWCFVGLMSRAIFVCTPTDSDMERNLVI
ncbi:TBC1 domain family member 16-like [Nilaparvata lugens]|uniref:TBC1 domain family member 16-like n=1 Tax=Nilaparvata lugens TaxID=108931 RepID=UPI00193DF080|nr:TBC1 domain family member 16-like [Nilaparvata lugens]